MKPEELRECSAKQMEWRVTLQPLDDFYTQPSPQDQRWFIEECVKEFRKKLVAALKRGEVIFSYGPLEE